MVKAMTLPTVYNFSSTENLGDRVCSPHLYFDWLKEAKVKMPDQCVPGPAIFGGGGLFHPYWDQFIFRSIRENQPTAIWGAGLNYHGCQEEVFPKELESCSFVGLRHFKNPWNYVPCVSCMAHEFDTAISSTPSHEVVIYEHRNHPVQEWKNAPRMNNFTGSLSDAVSFLASGQIVVTTSFHGAYWAKLIGRAVGIYKPFSNRFLAIPGITPVQEETYIGTNGPPPMLYECRMLNIQWSDKLREFFGV